MCIYEEWVYKLCSYVFKTPDFFWRLKYPLNTEFWNMPRKVLLPSQIFCFGLSSCHRCLWSIYLSRTVVKWTLLVICLVNTGHKNTWKLLQFLFCSWSLFFSNCFDLRATQLCDFPRRNFSYCICFQCSPNYGHKRVYKPKSDTNQIKFVVNELPFVPIPLPRHSIKLSEVHGIHGGKWGQEWKG